MVDIVHSILPVWILSLIVTHLSSRSIVLLDRFHFALLRHHLKRLERSLLNGVKLHSMRIYDTGLFLKVEGILLSKNLRLRNLITEFLLVVRHGAFGVGILHKAIGTSHSSATLSVAKCRA